MREGVGDEDEGGYKLKINHKAEQDKIKRLKPRQKQNTQRIVVVIDRYMTSAADLMIPIVNTHQTKLVWTH
ncbi:MAG: hypothetical protein WB421_13520 [Terriglobales bacterium]